MSGSAAALASGKGHRDENFPVASVLLKAEHRAPTLAFYRFARAADDVADAPDTPAPVRLALLDGMRGGLLGTQGGEATSVALAATLAEHRLTSRHALDLLTAFERDCTVDRYADWDGLIDYCRVSAMPVGRYVLDVHGEAETLWPASDALCAALQIVNHLQDCGKDYRTLGRVYLPLDTLAAAGAVAEDLGAPRATPALRRAIAGLAERTEGLLAESAGFSARIRDTRLAVEVAVIHRLALDLVRMLKARDPLSERVHHSKPHALGLAALAALSRLTVRR